MTVEPVPQLTPLWLIFAATFVLSIVAIEIGALLGRRRRERLAETRDEISSLVGAMLGLLGFLLAIVFGTQISRFDAYRQLELEDANGIYASWLQADTLPSPYRERVRSLLQDYIAERITAMRAREFERVLVRSNELHDEIWAEAIAGTAAGNGEFPMELLLESLTEMARLHERRVSVGLYQRMPLILWLALILLSMLAMGVTGYQGGLTGAKRTAVRIVTILAFSMLVTLIADLSRPEAGLLKVQQRPLIDIQQRMAVGH